MNKKYKVITVWILVVCLLAASIMPAVAERDVSVLSDDIVTRISNPDNEPGQADGLIPLGDRTAGYGWALAERGDYIYIGTWRNTVGAVVRVQQRDVVIAITTGLSPSPVHMYHSA